MAGCKRQYSLKVIFISLLVRLQFSAAFGMFHFAVKSISIDSLVSGRILKKVSCENFYRVFLPPKMKLKVDLRMREYFHQVLNEQILAHS